MSRSRLGLLTVSLLAALGAPAGSQQPPAALGAKALTARIDLGVSAGWKTAAIRPAAPADDAEFLRRVYLDLAGRIPSVTEARRFLDDKQPDRRERLVEHLLSSPRYAAHFGKVLRALWLPEAAAGIQGQLIAPGFEAWLRDHLSDNTPYDKLVRELLTAPLADDNLGGRSRLVEESIFGRPSPIAFYLAKDVKAENLAGATARLFLGVKIECAQCHAHPFADWKREQFWQLAAFFAGIRGEKMEEFTLPVGEDQTKHAIKIPETDKVVQAAFLDGTEPRWKEGVGARATLAAWVTADGNPYFARAVVNRLWSYFFGTGLHEPVDEMTGDGEPPGHPRLLDELARQFVANKYDLKHLMRAIVLSRPYHLSAAGKPGAGEAPGHFARAAVRGLSGEQLFDSIARATGYVEAEGTAGGYLLRRQSPRAEFLTRFADTGEKATEHQTSILQALALMNGKLVSDGTSLEKSETLAAVADAPFLDTAGRVETLFLAALSRRPRADELSRYVRYVEGGGAAVPPSQPVSRQAYQRALADVFWVLLNSGEFMLNH